MRVIFRPYQRSIRSICQSISPNWGHLAPVVDTDFGLDHRIELGAGREHQIAVLALVRRKVGHLGGIRLQVVQLDVVEAVQVIEIGRYVALRGSKVSAEFVPPVEHCSEAATFSEIRSEASGLHELPWILACRLGFSEELHRVAVVRRQPAVGEQHTVPNGMHVGVAGVGQRRAEVLARQRPAGQFVDVGRGGHAGQ